MKFLAQVLLCFFFISTIQLSVGKKYDTLTRLVYDTTWDTFRLVNSGNDLNDEDDYLHSPNDVGWMGFSNAINETGWSLLEIHTFTNFPDSVQAYGAGLLEGSATRDLIAKHWHNTVGDYCANQEIYCAKLRAYLTENLNFMIEQVTRNRNTDPYWHHVGLVLEQLAGLEDGYNDKLSSEPHMNITIFGLNLLNINGDTEDLEYVVGKRSGFKRILGSGSCSALIKLLPNNADLYASQDTWNDFQSMLRILKHYDLPFHRLPNDQSPLIPGKSASFSSYPGSLQSGDDFYVLSSGLTTLETTIGNGNLSLYKGIKPNTIVLEWIRSIVANRLSSNGQEWASTFSKLNSGTYNNQWMIVDYNRFFPGKPLIAGLLTIVEQIPKLIYYADMTDLLSAQGYWPSYNTPYFKSIFNLSGGPENVAKYGDWFTYERTPRALIFKRDHGNVVDVPSMIKLMRYNDYTHDPLSACQCNPPYSAENAIAARSDLNPKNGTYPFSALGHRPHGATDMKLTTNELRKKLRFVAIGGPPHDNVPAFKWSTSDFKDLNHVGHPDEWTFEPITPTWQL